LLVSRVPDKPHFAAYNCKTCGAKPGEICRTKRGAPYPHTYHADRVWQGIDDGWFDDGGPA